MATELENKKRQRRDFMIKLYDETGGDENLSVVMYEIGEELGLNSSETDQVTQYLIGEGLIELLSYDRDVRLTHLGVVEVEASKENPQQPTQHFPAVNVINIGQMTNSQLQQGTHDSTQTGAFNTANAPSIQRFLEELRRQLPNLPLSNDDHDEVAGDVATIEAQLSSSRPKREIIGTCMNAIKAMFALPAVRDAASSELIHLMHQLPI